MNINNFMDTNIVQIRGIIDSLPRDFSSHDFIEKFSRRYEAEYIDMLVEYQHSGNAFKSVHGQIARYLSVNQDDLGIAKTEKGDSEHVFGELDRIQWWKH